MLGVNSVYESRLPLSTKFHQNFMFVSFRDLARDACRAEAPRPPPDPGRRRYAGPAAIDSGRKDRAPRSNVQLLAQQVIHEFRIRLAACRFHHLADEKTERARFAGTNL